MLIAVLLLGFAGVPLNARENGPVAPASPPPNWAIDPDDWQFNMSALIRVSYQGAPSNVAGNIAAAFVGNELRGVATPVIVGGQAYFFLTVYSNIYNGETVNFRVYYAPDDAVYSVEETVTFRHNLTVGTLNAPLWIDIDPNQDFPPELLAIPPDTTLQTVPFAPVDLADYLVSLDGDPVTWLATPGSNLTATLNGSVLTVAPASPTWTGTDSVRIIVRENTAAQLADTVYALFTVLPNYGQPSWLTIPNQTIFPGQSFTPFDLDDFLNFAGPCRQYDLDVFPFTGTTPDPGWTAPPPGAQPMTVVARPVFADEQLAGPGARLAAFVGGTLAGTATPAGNAPNISYTLQLANVGAGPIEFRFYHAENQYLYVVPSPLAFAAGGSAGTVSNPYVVQLSPLLPAVTPAGEVTVTVLDPTWTGTYPVDFIVWDCNFPDQRDTATVLFTITADNRPNITSPTTVNFEENACTTLYDAQTSDPNNSEGNGLTYSLAGGPDAVRFAIDAQTGVLSWGAGFSPDFENPQDADANNTYLVNIRVTNAANLSDTLSLTVTVTNQAAEPFAVSINNGASVICTTTTTTLTAAGGGSYAWSTGATTPSIVVASAGTYAVTATSTGGCTATASVMVSAPVTITAGGSATVCLGAPIQLTSTPSAGGDQPYTFAWSGPNGFTAAVQNPPAFASTAAAAGGYTVTVTTAGGCTATASRTVTVTANPAPTITATNSGPVCSGTALQLNSTPAGGSGTYTAYSWSGPNSYAAGLRNPVPFTATVAAAGTYSVTVTDNAGCTGTGTTTVTVNPLPTVVAANNGPVCTGSNVALTATPAGGTGGYAQFAWSGPGGFTAAQQNPAPFPATAAAAGLYRVTVTDGAGCTSTGGTTLAVTASPTATAALAYPACANGTVALTSTPTSGGVPTAFAWSGPNGYTATVEDPAPFAATAAAAGTYTVTITVASGCTTTASVTVNVLTGPSITAANSGPLCAGASLALSSTPSGGATPYSFGWSGPDGYAATVEDPVPFTTTSASAGAYQVVLTDAQGCTASATTTAVVHARPTITATSNSPLCAGANLNLQSLPQGGTPAYTFLWSGPNGFAATVEDPAPFVVSSASTGIYRVTLTDANGCSGTASTSVVVSAQAAPSVTATSNSPLCGGQQLVLGASASGGTGTYTAYAWAGPGGYSAAGATPAPFTVFPAASGVYTVTVTDSNNCRGTNTVSVQVSGPTPAPTSNSPVCPGGTVVLTGVPVVPGASYAWSGPNGFTSSQVNPAPFTAVPAASGTYSLTITENGCFGVGTTTVTIVDVTPPTIICPDNNTVAAGPNCTSVLGTFAPGSVSDNCNPAPAVTQSPAASTVLTGHNVTQVVTLTANDGNGNTAACSFTVTQLDQSVPTITCPANTTISASGSCNGTVGSYLPVSVGDNCNPAPAVTQSPAASTVLTGHNAAQIVTLTANDGNGNSSSCSLIVTLLDVTPPAITCPANTTVSANSNCSSALGSYNPVAIGDNCNPAPPVTQSPAASTVLSGHNAMQTVTLIANDGNGNTASCTLTVTLRDVTPPTITCPPSVTLNADAACTTPVGSYAPVSLSDNCAAPPAVTQAPAAATMLTGHNATQTVTLTANDGNGNTAACSLTVTVIDVTPPTITCPPNTTIAANSTCSGAIGSYTAVSVNDNCNAAPSVAQSPASTTVLTGHNAAQTVTLTANDGNGNTASCTLTVTLKDVTPPTITCPPNVTLNANAACSSALGAYNAVATGDNCTANPAVTQSPAAATIISGHNTVQIVTLTANDGNGNTATCALTVTLRDVTPPTLVCPANTTVAAGPTCTGLLGAYAPAVLNDNCNASPALTQSPAATTVLTGHNTAQTVTLTANDGNGNTASCAFVVTLRDVTPPTVTCLGSLLIFLDGAGTATLAPTTFFVSGSDNCGTVTPQSVAPSTFTCADIGIGQVTLTVSDGNGNTATCVTPVEVKDTISPTVVCQPATVALNAAGQGAITPSSVFQSASDNCDVSITLLSVTPSAFACNNLGTNVVVLRVVDDYNNSSTCTAVVTVVDLLPPTMACTNATVNLSAAGTAGILPIQVNAGSFDNCTLTSVTVTPATFTCANVGTNTVTLTGTDPSGNTGTCTATVTVNDVTPPTALCKPAIINLGSNGTAPVPPSAINNNSSDQCSIVSLVTVPATVTCANLGTISVTLVVTDIGGNTATCTAAVQVRDLLAPTALCKPATIFLNAAGQATLPATAVDNGSSDNCTASGALVRTVSPNTFTCANLSAAVTVTLTVRDASNNSATCTASVTVKDNIAPTAVCTNVTVNLSASGSVTVTGASRTANSTDNCSIVGVLPSSVVFTSAGTFVRTFTVRDYSNNTASCSATITVLPPQFAPPSQGTNASVAGAGPTTLSVGVQPNPTAGQTQLSFELDEARAYRVTVFDLTGKIVWEGAGEGLAGPNTHGLDFERMPPGWYFAGVRAGNLYGVVRILRQGRD